MTIASAIEEILLASPEPFTRTKLGAGAAITFHLDKEFNALSNFMLVRFYNDLENLVGEGVVPVEVRDGCIVTTARLRSQFDYLGRDIREMFWRAKTHHEFLLKYNVRDIYFYDFSNKMSDGGPYNYGHTNFSVNQDGSIHPK